MEENSRSTLDVIRSDENLGWVAAQLVASFSEGIAHSAKDGESVLQRDYMESMGLSPRERTKREKYETTRPYEESEKIDLIKFALGEVFLTLPSMQIATEKYLKELGSKASAIEFRSPDEEGLLEGTYRREFGQDNNGRIKDNKHRLAVFSEKLTE
jgi:hypothetical protein